MSKAPPVDQSRQADPAEALRQLYEQLPYPPRNPEDERQRLVRTSLDHLPKLSHYCFSGALDLSGPFRVLVAGGGTGDSAIYLGEQLRDTPATIYYLDVSKQSRTIAQHRAEVRGLDNIRFESGSLLDAQTTYQEPFDYINCSGVLHHLPDPHAGLKTLANMLKPEGALGIMVYAQYGRTAVYQVQELIQRMAGDQPLDQQIRLTRCLLKSLPDTNWFKRSESLHVDHKKLGDAGLADLLLNPSDRAYTIPELHQWITDAGLEFNRFASRRLHYEPLRYISDPALQAVIRNKPEQEQQAIAELISGALIKHTFYAGLSKPQPVTLQPQRYPVLSYSLNNRSIHEQLSAKANGTHLTITSDDAQLHLPVNPVSKVFFELIERPLRFDELVREAASTQALSGFPEHWVQTQLHQLCELLLSVDMLYLLKVPIPPQTN